ncbi:unnamed protein product [Aureobasidium vineae]|uniref:Uncharacterized protein n=1 Tax=Aureobasidium vineae TaxID=2773715 RepID=A0A9N8JRV2_9PEZI|nr:unnamed protein product [Aureobasidium vineae]
MNDLVDIKRRVDVFRSRQDNKGIVVRLLCRPELPSDFITAMEHEVLTRTMGIDATVVYTDGDIYDALSRGVYQCPKLRSLTHRAQREALASRWRIFNLLQGVKRGVSLEETVEMLKKKVLCGKRQDSSLATLTPDDCM